MIQILLANLCAAALICSAASVSAAQERPGQPKLDGAPRLLVLDHGKLKAYVTQFNADDEELYANVPNSEALAFLEQNIPLFECPDEDFQRTYYFRWWSYRKHVKQTPDGYVITEFLPNVQWAGKHNTISCPAAHHYYEGRWLRNTTYLDDYSVFWLRKGGDPRSYSFWIADAFYARYKVTPNRALITDLLPDLVRNYEAWEKGFNWSGSLIGLRENGLFYTLDILDGGEVSIGGHGFRPTLNSFMYGDAKAIAAIARLDNKGELAKQYEAKAAELKRLVQQKLWDKEAQFFKVLPDESAQGNREPQHSGDTTLLRHTWWSQERLGGTEWVQYSFDTPRRVSSVEIFWFHKINPDGVSGCAVPQSWELQVDDGSGFKPIADATAYGTEQDCFNRVSFAPVNAVAIRVVAKLRQGLSAGILEWRVFNNPDASGENLAGAAHSSASYTDKYQGTLKALNNGAKADEECDLVDVRELLGYTPWYFNLPDPGYEAGWKELMDTKGFYAPYGPTFAEQRHPKFTISYTGHECQWNGPSWPFATCNVLTALANLLNNYEQNVIDKQAYFETLGVYTRSHRFTREDGKVVPWIDENLNPFTGDWIARTRMEVQGYNHRHKERGKDYNHSTYNDLIITGLVGLRPRADEMLQVNPLLPPGTWEWFCLDNLRYHDRDLTIIWDKTGNKYGRGAGLSLFVDGSKLASVPELSEILVPLPAK